MSPINLYTTKALGREWIPSPVRSTSQIGRFGPYSPSSPKMKWSNEHLEPTSSNNSYFPQSPWRTRWTRIHERLLLTIVILFLLTIFTLWETTSPTFPALHWSDDNHQTIDWTKTAYGTYATSTDHLCNSLMLLSSLHNLNVKPKLLLMYDETWDSSPSTIQYERERKLLKKARNQYGAILRPVQLQQTSETSSFTKLLFFNQTDFSRILMLDSGSTVFKGMDELFLLPEEIPIAMPRAYWTAQGGLTSALALISPSERNMEEVHAAVLQRSSSDFVDQILTSLYGHSCLILPHGPYLLLSSSLHPHLHYSFSKDMGQKAGDVQKIMESVKMIYFDDPKPWLPLNLSTVPFGCTRYRNGNGYGEFEDDCQAREIWKALYADFRERRSAVCGSEFETWNDVEEEKEEEEVEEPVEDVEVLLADPMPEVDYRSLRYQVVQ